MPKRTVWFTTGAMVGLGSSYWVQRRAKQLAARYSATAIGRSAADGARRLGKDLKSAVSEGRTAARAKEQQLTAELNPVRLRSEHDQLNPDRRSRT